MNARKMTSAILVAMVALFLSTSACGTPTVFVPASPTMYPSPTTAPHGEPPTATPILLMTPTPVVQADCFLSFQVAAWQDLDGDGLWGASEPPLEGVEFRLQGTFAQIWGHPYLSDADGRLTITTWSPGRCIEQEYTITAVPPESYEPTTPASVTFSLTAADLLYETLFGFRAVSE